jgi:hypothetical protein
MLSTFSEAISRIPGLDTADLHEACRAAKLLRRRIESGHRPDEGDWAVLFPEPAVMRLAQIHLDEGPGTPLFDPEATLTGEEQDNDGEARGVDQEAWYEFLSDLPHEGLPCPARAGERVDSWQLGRMIYNVSRGMAKVDYDQLPVAGGFRERFVTLAHRTGRLSCIRGLPRSA